MARAQPVEPKGVAASDPVFGFERQELGQRLLLSTIEHVALILGADKSEPRDLGGEVAQLNSPEIGERDVALAPILLAPPVARRGTAGSAPSGCSARWCSACRARRAPRPRRPPGSSNRKCPG